MKRKSLIYIIIFVATTFGILLLIDIFTGFWFWNRYNLIFDSAEYNNIITPTLTFIATVIYGSALFLTIRQNKIILSQNIKPHYEREIESYIAEARNVKIVSTTVHSDKEINATNYIEYINESILALCRNQQFLEDYDNHNRNQILSRNHIMQRDYIFDLMFLSEFTLPMNRIISFYEKLKELIEEINQSKLINEDKKLLKKRIERSLLSEYLAFISFENKNSVIIPPIPLLYADFDKTDVQFGQISKTGFRKHYDYFRNEFK